MLRVHDLQNYAFDKIDPWGPILQNIAYAIRSIYHTTTEATPHHTRPARVWKRHVI
jgi:hypothetical protein